MEKKIFFGLLFLLNLSFIFGQPPTEIPKDIILAGAVDEFIDVSCAMAKYHMTQYIDGMNSVISHFENIKAEYPDYVSTETDELNTMTTELQSKLDALCSANADTYSSAISDITILSTGDNGLEKRGREIGLNMESQLKVKGEEQKTKGLGMKDIGNQLKEKGNQITSLQAQIQSAQGQNAQTIGMQI